MSVDSQIGQSSSKKKTPQQSVVTPAPKNYNGIIDVGSSPLDEALANLAGGGLDPNTLNDAYGQVETALGGGASPGLSPVSYSPSGRSSGGGGGRGGGGGGGAAVNQMYIDAMKAYLAKKEAGLGNYLAPYGDAASGIGTAYDASRAQISNMGQWIASQLAAQKPIQDQYNAQLRQGLTATGAQYDPGSLLRDLQAQGAGGGDLALRAQLMQQGQQEDAARRGGLADSLINVRNSDLSQRGDIANQQTAGMQGLLDINKLAYLAQNAKAKAAAQQSYNDQLEQLRLQMAQAGIAQ